MKKQIKSKVMLSIFIDFVFIIILISVIATAFFSVKFLLYPEQSCEGELKIRTEVMPKEYEHLISVGDSLFDTLTKRRVGEVTSLYTVEKDEEIYFILTVDAKFTPRSKALRTGELWFYFAVEDL